MDFDFQNIPTVNIPLSKLEENKGQIDGVPRNPRVVKDANFKKLVKSIQEDTEFLSLNCLHVFQQGKKYVVCNGNMRLKACRELGLKVVPCKVIPPDTSVEKLKRYIMKDNIDAGEWDWDAIHEEWDAAQLDDWGVEVPEMKETERLSELEIKNVYYEPKESLYDLPDCLDLTKYDKKIEFLHSLGLPKEVNAALELMCARFIRIDFEHVADYYHCKANEKEKEAIERLRLVLVDDGQQGWIDDELLRINQTITESLNDE